MTINSDKKELIDYGVMLRMRKMMIKWRVFINLNIKNSNASSVRSVSLWCDLTGSCCTLHFNTEKLCMCECEEHFRPHNSYVIYNIL